MEADVVLIFMSFILHHIEQHSIFHLQPEFTVFVFQHRFILFLEKIQQLNRLSFFYVE